MTGCSLRRSGSLIPLTFDTTGSSPEVLALIETHGCLSVAMPDRIIGCPHESGEDYPGAAARTSLLEARAAPAAGRDRVQSGSSSAASSFVTKIVT